MQSKSVNCLEFGTDIEIGTISGPECRIYTAIPPQEWSDSLKDRAR
jgi:hypothetical protein